MQSLKDLLPKSNTDLAKRVLSKHKYVSQEFQDYGYRLALKLDDVSHVSMYIRLAKVYSRAHMEQALSFTIDYPKAKNKPRIFLWKLKQLRDEYNLKNGIVPEVKEKKHRKTKSVNEEGSLFEGKRIKSVKKEKVIKKNKVKSPPKNIPEPTDQTQLF
jgi:hypothetical protein